MEHSPFITVYITNHNYEKFVQQSIESVLNQSFKDYELIIIDDGSLDNSWDIIAKYQDTPNIRLIRQQNKGLNVTNNIALKAARGEFIVRLDADDYFDHDALLVMSNYLKRNSDVDMLFADYYLTNEQGQVIGQERRHDFEKDVSLLDCPAHGACTIIRVKALHEVGGYNEIFKCQDGYDLWLKFIKKYKIRNINLPLFYYRQHQASLTKNQVRILSTRASIKNEYVKRSVKSEESAVAVIPLRGKAADVRDLPFQMVGDSYLIDYAIKSCIEAKRFEHIFILSEDEKILSYAKDNYGASVKTYKRSREDALENTHYHALIDKMLIEALGDKQPDLVLIKTSETPFISSIYLKDALDTVHIFETDLVIPVRLEDRNYFYHSGNGLVPFNHGKTTDLKLEQDQIYSQIPGMHVIRRDLLSGQFKVEDLKNGHVVIDQIAAHTIVNEIDLKIANLIKNGLDSGEIPTVINYPAEVQNLI